MVSLDKIFDYSTHDAGLSRSVQRRLRLLRAVLPVFTDGAAKKYTLAKKYSSERDFWTRALSPCLLMSMAEWPFERVNEDHGGLVKALLENLETTIFLDKPHIADEFSSSTFPRLEMLRKLLDSKAKDVDDLMLDVLVMPSMERICEELVKHLAEFAKVLKDTSYQPLPEETSTLQRKSRPPIGPVLLKALSTISRYWGCTSPHPHQTAILLFTHRANPVEEDVDVSFTMLFNQQTDCMRWQESTITVSGPQVNPPVLLVLPQAESSRPKSQGKHRQPVTRLCPVVSNRESNRLNFQIEDGSLLRLPETKPKMEELENGDAVSLADSLLQNDTELDFKGKSCLAVIISYSLLDYCQGPWFTGGLTRYTVHLIQQGPHLFLRPFLVTDMSQ
ncbi:hypothetical protein F4801DRAFT_557012 [Xylaria longipes]|nr:hypothetical protein F4801DRAFT_557012 [Xylaria longipes]